MRFPISAPSPGKDHLCDSVSYQGTAGPDFYSVSGNNHDQDAFELATKAVDEAAQGQKMCGASGMDHSGTGLL